MKEERDLSNSHTSLKQQKKIRTKMLFIVVYCIARKRMKNATYVRNGESGEEYLHSLIQTMPPLST
jgi:hypothetical protein